MWGLKGVNEVTAATLDWQIGFVAWSTAKRYIDSVTVKSTQSTVDEALSIHCESTTMEERGGRQLAAPIPVVVDSRLVRTAEKATDAQARNCCGR